MLIYNARIITPGGEQHWLRWDGSRITALGTGDPGTIPPGSIDAGGRTVIPGMIDLHVHGSIGHDVMDATPEALTMMARHFARHGVTGWLPTTLTHRHEALMAALENIRACAASQPPGRARILGARLEGPYLNEEKAGAQNPQYIREPRPEEANQYLDLGIIRIVDVAPEMPGTDWLIRECTRRGVVTSLAHSNATAEQAIAAHALGLGHSTHTFNAQPPLLHRAPGAVGAVLATDTFTAEVVSDGVHVHPFVIKVVARCKGANTSVITDAIRPAGMPPGEYAFDERTVILRDDVGGARLPNGTLAGSTLTMNKALKTFYEAIGGDLLAAVTATSDAPARRIGLGERKGHLAPGKDADFAVIDADFGVTMTVIEGEIAFSEGAG